MTVQWAVVGVGLAPGSAGARGLDLRAERLRVWARAHGDPLGAEDAQAVAQTIREGVVSGELSKSDHTTAELWLRAGSRRWPRPGREVLARILEMPAVGKRISGTGRVAGAVEIDTVLAMVRSTGMAGVDVTHWDADVPWGASEFTDTHGWIPVRVRGFLPDPYVTGVAVRGVGDSEGWLWLPEARRGAGPTPVWVEDIQARSRVFLLGQLGPYGIPLRADLDRIMGSPPNPRMCAWLVRRPVDGSWWACWVVK